MQWWTPGQSRCPGACVFALIRSHTLHLCKDQAMEEIGSVNCPAPNTDMHPPYLLLMSPHWGYKDIFLHRERLQQKRPGMRQAPPAMFLSIAQGMALAMIQAGGPTARSAPGSRYEEE